MADPVASRNPLFWALFTGVAAACLWLALAVSGQDQMLGTSDLHAGLRIASILVTAAAFVVITERLVIAVLFRPSLGREATGLQRALTFGILTFLASFAALSYLGIDLRTVLATSAVATFGVGFALQPTLSSLVSGLNVQLDAGLRVGDRIEHEGSLVTITAMTWRTTAGRRLDGATVVITNARLAENPIVIHRQDEAASLEMNLGAPLELSPGQAAALILDVLIGLETVDLSKPFKIAPLDLQAGDQAQFQLTALLRPGEDAGSARGEIARRLWYAYQRRGLRLSPKQTDGSRINDFDAPRHYDRALEPFLVGGENGDRRLGFGCRILMYGPGERLVVPERMEEWLFLILDGRAVKRAPFLGGGELAADLGFTEVQGRQVDAAGLAAQLTQAIGPYGDYAVWSQVRRAKDPAELRRRVGEQIEDEALRRTLLDFTPPTIPTVFTPGDLLHGERDALGVLTCGQDLRAKGELSLLALPGPAWERLPGGAARKRKPSPPAAQSTPA